MWADRSVAFSAIYWMVPHQKCMSYSMHINPTPSINCTPRSVYPDVMCELETASVTVRDNGIMTVRSTPSHILMPLPGNQTLPVPFVTCPTGHVTHAFMVCDEQTSCWLSRRYRGSYETVLPPTESCSVTMTSFPVTFTCTNGLQHVPYSMVCDHRQHCADNSDETFCVFPPCSGSTPLQCDASTQCVQLSDICNGQYDCSQGTDEGRCANILSVGSWTSSIYLSPPAVIHFTPISYTEGENYPFVMSELPLPTQLTDSSSPCPNTHFQCPVNGYCLPVFVRCNGVNDCPGREDEAECDSVSCPGFYRCRSSRVCLHPSHVCDGMYQCPQQDDEVFCHLTCPAGCTCHGLAFTCHQPFRAELHIKMKYLDASGSGITPTQLRRNTLLVYLSLSRCGLDELSNMSFPNLRGLDVSHNDLTTISVRHLQGMRILRYLSLSQNPLESLFFQGTNLLSFPALRTLDLSGVKIQRLNTRTFSPFPGLQKLNLSHCGVDHISGEGFHAMTKLRILVAEGCPATQFPQDLLSGLDQLQTVSAGNYKLCCEDTLPPDFNLANCKAPFDEVSSCKSLLRSDVYMVFLSVFSSLALLGNLGCFLMRNCYLKSGASGFGVFVTHLSISDFLMGVYLAVIGVADRLLKSSYLWEDIWWRHSVSCKVAGFLSLMSNEVSAFIICLITLDRFLVLRFPFSSVHFKARSAHVTCAVVWVVGMVIAVLPLTPVVSHWSFYSQTGICIPLPVTRKDFSGRHYAFGVIIVFNFILFLLIAAGQAAIYMSVRANSLSMADSTKKSTDLRIARRLISVAVSDFLCWFPIGLLGLLASSGIAISGEVNVGMAILVLPLNSTINPFLYTVNVLLERRRQSRDRNILKQIMTQSCGEERTPE